MREPNHDHSFLFCYFTVVCASPLYLFVLFLPVQLSLRVIYASLALTVSNARIHKYRWRIPRGGLHPVSRSFTSKRNGFFYSSVCDHPSGMRRFTSTSLSRSSRTPGVFRSGQTNENRQYCDCGVPYSVLQSRANLPAPIFTMQLESISRQCVGIASPLC